MLHDLNSLRNDFPTGCQVSHATGTPWAPSLDCLRETWMRKKGWEKLTTGNEYSSVVRHGDEYSSVFYFLVLLHRNHDAVIVPYHHPPLL